MINKKSARERTIIRKIEKRILEAIDNGEFQITTEELTNDEIDILSNYGYTVTPATDAWGENTGFDVISWK